jgi:hypothetical protein
MANERVAVAGGRPLFFSALSDLYLNAGKPSARSISRELGDVSHTTVADLLGGRRLASWAITRRVIRRLGGDESDFQPLWVQAVDEPSRVGAVAVSGDIGTVTTHIGTQVLGVPPVPVSMAAKDPHAVFTAVNLGAFTGREWLVHEVDRFVADNPCGYVFIEADAGLGKTTFAAWLVKTRRYLSHFSRYSDGRSVRAALQNLSAQLIISCGLDEEAPGGILPGWAQTPSGFEALLGKAAWRGRENGPKLVLVVDGLDEAEPSVEGLPFGLPVLLPSGVFVIGTYRTGRAPLRPSSPHATLRIGQHDPRNRHDIRAFLIKAAAEGVLAARLAEANLDVAEFTDMLADRCDGVWIYVQYVLQELRLGLRRSNAIVNLPAGLRDYYADQIRRWQRNPAWNRELLPLLATLGIAGEPLPASALARLAGGLDPVAVRRWCDLTLRPLLTATRADAVSQPLRYGIYHASFREALRADDAASRSEPDDQPYELAALADELEQAAFSAHSRIADIYLEYFGGLNTGLRTLAENPRIAGTDDDYPLRHLARHLQHASRVADLHRLMTIEQKVSSDVAFNVWFVAHDWADDIASYLEDVARARDVSAVATDEALGNHQPATALGVEIRYDLMTASIASRAARISADLLDQAIRTGLWSTVRGLDHARTLINPQSRVDALMTVHRHLNADDKPSVLAQALTAATEIADGEARVRALSSLSPYLPADQLAQVLEASTATDDYTLPEILASLAPYLPGDQLAQALAAATEIADGEARVRALSSLAPHLPADRRAQMLAAALAAATEIADGEARVRALSSLAPHLPADRRAQMLAAALAAATEIADGEARVRALSSLAPHLPADQLAQALAAATEISDGPECSHALSVLASYLPASRQTQVLATAAVVADNSEHAQTMAWDPPVSDDEWAKLSNNSDRVRASVVLADGRVVVDQMGAIQDDQAKIKVLRRILAKTDRQTCLNVIMSVAPMIVRLGGASTVEECIKAITDVHRWWI